MGKSRGAALKRLGWEKNNSVLTGMDQLVQTPQLRMGTGIFNEPPLLANHQTD